mmetsp:Transcript_70554/g.106740  ORF Transcript_70554/g.106740 Transcript_70554/m.106740 type:complete len:228 (+) Transcript_70554:3163-3846(+)
MAGPSRTMSSSRRFHRISRTTKTRPTPRAATTTRTTAIRITKMPHRAMPKATKKRCLRNSGLLQGRTREAQEAAKVARVAKEAREAREAKAPEHRARATLSPMVPDRRASAVLSPTNPSKPLPVSSRRLRRRPRKRWKRKPAASVTPRTPGTHLSSIRTRPGAERKKHLPLDAVTNTTTGSSRCFITRTTTGLAVSLRSSVCTARTLRRSTSCPTSTTHQCNHQRIL